MSIKEKKTWVGLSFKMSSEFRVMAIDPRLDVSGRLQQTPRCEAQLNREIANKLGFIDGDLLEIKGKKTTAAKIVCAEKGLDFNSVGLNSLVRTNAQVLQEENVTIRKAESKTAKKIVFAPIGKPLKKSAFLEMVAKKSFLYKPFVAGDATYLRSKITRYLPGSATWLRVVTTEPEGVVVVGDETEIEIAPDPVAMNGREAEQLPDLNAGEDYSDVLDESEWEKINSLIELGLFSNTTEALGFFLREGIKARSDVFEKSIAILEQMKQLKENIKIA